MKQPIQESYVGPAYQATEKPLTREDIRALLRLAVLDYNPSDALRARIMASVETTPQDKPDKKE